MKNNSNPARHLVLSSVRHGEQTEDYLFCEAARRGIPQHQLNAEIAELVKLGRIVETVIDSPPRPWGIGPVDALRLAP